MNVMSKLVLTLAVLPAFGQQLPASAVVFENVRVFRGGVGQVSAPAHVLVVGNTIKSVSSAPIANPAGLQVTRIAGNGRTLMPGLINAHTHLMMASLPQVALLTAEIGFVNIAAAKAAEAMLMQGFTSVRDLGGPVFGLKAAVDQGLVPGPRIWPAGAMISQTSGHGDFRLPSDIPARPGDFTYAERTGTSAIADSPDLVRLRAREQLMKGASHIKVMAGGGAASMFDPLDVTQYTVEEIRAAVEAAENWGTYVTVHAYTPRAIRQSIEAGVKCIDHGHLVDEETARLMAEKGVWWSLQPFTEDRKTAFEEGSPNRLKQMQVAKGTERAYALARKHQIKTAWGTDTLFSRESLLQQAQMITLMQRWYSPAEVLQMVTSTNAELLALSGLRSPYEGRLGVVEEGALADLLLVEGNPLENLRLFEDYAKNLLVIMKDGKIYKNLLAK
jgi:imidazolonepropionase-like amidohydrolase